MSRPSGAERVSSINRGLIQSLATLSPRLPRIHNYIGIIPVQRPSSKHLRNITMTSVCSNWSDILLRWPSTTVAGTSDSSLSTEPNSILHSAIASLSKAWVDYYQLANTPAPSTALFPSSRNSARITVPTRINSLSSGLDSPKRPVSRTTGTAVSRPSSGYYPPPPSTRTKSQTQLESLRTRQGEAWSLQAVRTAFDVVEEMCGTVPRSSITDSSTNGFSKIIASLDLPLQIATMESYKNDRRSHEPRRRLPDISRTVVEDHYMSGALPSRKSLLGIKRRGRHIPASAISDVKEDYVRTRKR